MVSPIGRRQADLPRQDRVDFARDLKLEGTRQAIVNLQASGVGVFRQRQMGDCVVRVPDSRHKCQSIGDKRYGMPIFGHAEPSKCMSTVCGRISVGIPAELLDVSRRHGFLVLHQAYNIP